MPIDEPIHNHNSIVQSFTFSVLFILLKYNRKKLCVTFSTLCLTLTQMRLFDINDLMSLNQSFLETYFPLSLIGVPDAQQMMTAISF